MPRSPHSTTLLAGRVQRPGKLALGRTTALRNQDPLVRNGVAGDLSKQSVTANRARPETTMPAKPIWQAEFKSRANSQSSGNP